MPFYKFKCEDCDSEFVIKKNSKDIKEYESCSCCNGLGKRDYSNIMVDTTHELRDPKSSRFWKNNMSVSEQADVIAGTKDPY